MQFTEKQQQQLATILGYLSNAPIPIRQPGWEEQGYWGRPIAQSVIAEVPTSPLWQPLITVSPPTEYNSVIRQYTAAPIYLPYPAGLQFRIRVDSTVLDANLPAGIDRHHAGGVNAFPLIRQLFQSVLVVSDLFAIEVLNTSGNPQLVGVACYGWHYFDPSGEISSPEEAQVDSTSPDEIAALEFFDE